MQCDHDFLTLTPRTKTAVNLKRMIEEHKFSTIGKTAATRGVGG